MEEVLVALLPALVGPGSAVIALLLVMFGIYMLIVKVLAPLARDGMTQILKEHAEDRKAFLESIGRLDAKLDEQTKTLTVIVTRIEACPTISPKPWEPTVHSGAEPTRR